MDKHKVNAHMYSMTKIYQSQGTCAILVDINSARLVRFTWLFYQDVFFQFKK